MRLALAQNATLTLAESCTGGLLSGAITDAAGSSQIFERGYVTYSNDAKIEMLGVRPETLLKFGAVSEQIAVEMAAGALAAADATVALAVSGIAGPGGSEHKPEGRVCFGLVHAGATPTSETVEFGAVGRAQVRQQAVAHGLAMLIGALS